MSDSDGVSGTATQQVTVTTRSTPKIYTSGRTLHVYPPDCGRPKNAGHSQTEYGKAPRAGSEGGEPNSIGTP